MDVIPLTMSSSSKFLQIPTTLTLTFKLSSSPNKPTNPSLLPNSSNPTLTLRLHLTHKPKNPIFHTPSKTHHHLHHPLFSTPPNNPAPPPDHQSEQFKAAQDAFWEFLQECVVSETEAAFVSSNSPRYLRMLVDGVLELDELGLWRERERKEGRELVGFKEKVRYLAKEKGDNGKVAFLESVVGLSLSSAMNLARHLSAVTLPRLVEKVLWVRGFERETTQSALLPNRYTRCRHQKQKLDLWKFLRGNLQQHLELVINSRSLDRSPIQYPLLMWQLGRRKTEAQKSLSAGHHEVQQLRRSNQKECQIWNHNLLNSKRI